MAGIVEGGVVPSNKVVDDGSYDKYELESACETLVKAEEIKADVKLMKALRPLLEKKAKAYHTLEDLRTLATRKLKEEREGSDEDTKQMAAQEGEMGYKRT